ncbi:hypothetical protein K0B04_04000 [Patescibacteria group bacterium]|nr:hypothetical protein [Patescibacteria group bacterium]
MRIYIGYKYRNFKDKENLKENLSKISDALTSLEHKTFILGRDEFNWNHHKSPSKSVRPIVKNMRKNDVLFALIECESKSTGLLFETMCAKLMGKKIIIAVKNDVSGKPFKNYTKNVIEFETYEDLNNKISTELKNYL